MFKSLEVFCGAGGLALGLSDAGFSHSAMYDLNELAIFTANTNHQKLATCIDIRGHLEHLISIHKGQDFDLLAGGPPCQPFSIGGSGRANKDERNFLPEMIRLIREIRPKTFLIENVAGLFRGDLSAQNYGNLVKLELQYCDYKGAQGQSNSAARYKELSRLNTASSDATGAYRVQVWRMNAADYGVPQIRRRAFLVGVRNDVKPALVAPSSTHTKEQLFFEQFISGDYWRRHGLKQPKDKKKELLGNIHQHSLPGVQIAKPWLTVRDALLNFGEPSICSSVKHPLHVLIPGARMYPGHSGSDFDQPSKTITAGTHGVGGGQNTLRLKSDQVRYLSLFECQILQTFPEDYEFVGSRSAIHSQIGNAVPPLLGKAVGEALAACLK